MVLDFLVSSAARIAMFERRFKYVKMGYQAYNRVSDAMDIAEAVYWVGAFTAAIYFDAAAHSGGDDNGGDDFTFDVAEAAEEDAFDGPTSSRPATAGVGLAALFLLFEEAAKQGHHIATDKHSTWTPKFERMFTRAGVSLQNTANIIPVRGHSGPHPDEYHKEIYKRLTSAVRGTKPGSQQMKKQLILELKKLGKECARPGSPLNQMIVKRMFRR